MERKIQIMKTKNTRGDTVLKFIETKRIPKWILGTIYANKLPCY